MRSTTATTFSNTVCRSSSDRIVEKPTQPADTGVVDQQIDAERLGVFDEVVAFAGVREIGFVSLDSPSLTRDPLGGLRQSLFVTAGQQQIRVGRQLEANAAPIPLEAPVTKARR